MDAPRGRQQRGVRTVWLVIATAVVTAVMTAAVVLGAAHVLGWNTAPAAVSACNVQRVSDSVLPSVLTIFARGRGGAGTGSGTVIDKNGYLLTNNHVISHAANGGSVQVLFTDGAEAKATITGRDPATDLAVLHVNPPHPLKAIGVGPSAALAIGEPVVALGAPLGCQGRPPPGSSARSTALSTCRETTAVEPCSSRRYRPTPRSIPATAAALSSTAADS